MENRTLVGWLLSGRKSWGREKQLILHNKSLFILLRFNSVTFQICCSAVNRKAHWQNERQFLQSSLIIISKSNLCSFIHQYFSSCSDDTDKTVHPEASLSYLLWKTRLLVWTLCMLIVKTTVWWGQCFRFHA